MTLIALTSAKHSPGVSTLAASLAALAAEDRPVVLVEADPSGGDIAARAGLRLEPGVATLAVAARRGMTDGLLDGHLQPLHSGARVLVAPVDPEHAMSALRALGARLAQAIASSDAATFVDLGRWRGDHPAVDVVHAADVVVLVITPTVEGVEHARWRIESLHVDPARLVVVAVGERPYQAPEIAATLGVPVASIAHDRRSAEIVAAGFGLDRWLRRSLLVRSARSLLDQLAAQSATPPIGATR